MIRELEDRGKEREYAEAISETAAVLQGETDLISRMATICSILKRRVGAASWVGFYRLTAPGLLTVGPYQGEIGCLRIPFDRGVCGAAARTRTAQIVGDVSRFPGHIACDASARSEIVIPVFDAAHELIAVLDLDSRELSAFDDVDRTHLERIVTLVDPGSMERRGADRG